MKNCDYFFYFGFRMLDDNLFYNTFCKVAVYINKVAMMLACIDFKDWEK